MRGSPRTTGTSNPRSRLLPVAVSDDLSACLSLFSSLCPPCYLVVCLFLYAFLSRLLFRSLSLFPCSLSLSHTHPHVSQCPYASCRYACSFTYPPTRTHTHPSAPRCWYFPPCALVASGARCLRCSLSLRPCLTLSHSPHVQVCEHKRIPGFAAVHSHRHIRSFQVHLRSTPPWPPQPQRPPLRSRCVRLSLSARLPLSLFHPLSYYLCSLTRLLPLTCTRTHTSVCTGPFCRIPEPPLHAHPCHVLGGVPAFE